MSQPAPPRRPQAPPAPSEETPSFPRQKLLLLSILPLLVILSTQLANPKKATSDPDRAEIVQLTLSLARIASPSGDEQAVFSYARDWLSQRNATVHTQPIPGLTAQHAARENVLAVFGEISEIEVLLFTHLDTVPGGPAPAVEGDVLVGRGVVDAKGQAAGMMLTFVRNADPRVGLLLVCGEETDHSGIRSAVELGIPGDVTLINGEPTEGMLVRRQKGALRVVLEASGQRAHSGYPHLGESAIDKMMAVLADLRELWPGMEGETMNIGTITGGTAANVVAGEAEALVLWRVLGSAEDVLRRVKGVTSRYDGVKIADVRRNDALVLHVPARTGALFGVCEVSYNTDIPHYQGSYKRALLFGGGSITVAHTEHEQVRMSELEEYERRLDELVNEVLES